MIHSYIQTVHEDSAQTFERVTVADVSEYYSMWNVSSFNRDVLLMECELSTYKLEHRITSNKRTTFDKDY